MACVIADGVVYDCAAPPAAGVEARAIGMNLEDWLNATVTLDATTNEIETITLASTKQGYQFSVPKGSRDMLASEAFRGVDGVDGFDHIIQARFATFVQKERENLSLMKWTRTVWIVPLTEGRAMLYGGGVKADGTPIGVGLTVSAWEANPGDASTGATTLVTLDNTDSPPIANPAHLIEASFDIDTLLTPAA